jgi:regulator of ribonuclease activity A
MVPALSRSFSTADLCDRYLPQAESGAQYALPGLMSFGGLPAYQGPVATIAAGDVNAVGLRDTLSQPGQGRVLVVDNGGHPEWAVLGDRLASLALSNGWAGMVVYGYIRDVATLRNMPIGIHALGSVPARPARFSSGESEGVVEFLNVRFRPQSWLYADEDGLVLLPNAALGR